MRLTSLSASLALVVGVSALPQRMREDITQAAPAPALPHHVFDDTKKFIVPVVYEDAKSKNFSASTTNPSHSTRDTRDTKAKVARQGGCQNGVRQRVEWDSMSDQDRRSFIQGIQCLMRNRPSGNFANAQSRYEDIVSVHQLMSGTIHGNDIFLFWHRYFTYAFEDILRTECGLNIAIPWFDETRYTGNFPGSSIFSSNYFGSLNSGGNCVTDSQFNNAQESDGTGVVNLDIGPGTSDQLHCLTRNYDPNSAGQVSSGYVSLCTGQGDYHSMGSCTEGGPHAFGHIGIGGVMNDIYGSVGDATFFLHHGFVDHMFYSWQQADTNDRYQPGMVNGNDINNNPISAGTTISVMGLRADVTIGDLIDPTNGFMCYSY